jgi:broad specificity phosphatase PhoE
MQLVLIRHAESIWNAEDRWQGQTDVPLSERGREEARALGVRLASLEAGLVVSSDLVRAADTADAVRSAMAVGQEPPSLRRHAGLREMDLGAWCGLPHAEVLSRYPDEVEALRRGDDVPIGGHGESLPRFEARVHAALAEVLAEAADARRVVVVTHGGCIRAVLMRLLGLRGRGRPLEGVSNTSLTTLAVEAGRIARLETYNDARHLRPVLGGPHSTSGPAGRERVVSLLGLDADAPLAVPADDAVTTVVPEARRLVAYAVPSASLLTAARVGPEGPG